MAPQHQVPPPAGAAVPEERRASSNTLLIVAIGAMLIGFLAVVGVGAYIVFGKRAQQPSVEMTADAHRPAEPNTAMTGRHAAGGQTAPPPEEDHWEDAPVSAEAAPEQTAVTEPGSLDPFPAALAQLRENPAAWAAAQTVGSSDGLPLDDYGDEWVVEFIERRGPFVFLLVEAGEFHSYVVLLRESSDDYEYLMGMQDLPGVADFKAAGITPAEYRDHLLDYWGQWPWTDSGGTASDW